MDNVERRAWMISLILHGGLVLVTLIGFGGGPTNPPLPPLPPLPEMVDRPEAIKKTPPPAALPELEMVLAEDAVLPVTADVALPALPLGQASVPILMPSSLAPKAKEASAGTDHTLPDIVKSGAEVATLPTLETIRAKRSAALPANWEEDNRRTAATTLQMFLEQKFWQQWRALSTRISQRDLVLWIETDSTNHIARGGLFHCSTGLEDLDRSIEHWLTHSLVGLPPVAPNTTHYIRIRLP